MSYFREVFFWLKEALFPKKCLLCQKMGDFLCDHHRELPEPIIPTLSLFKYLDGISAVTNYHHPVSEALIQYFKFQGFRDLSQFLAQEILKLHPTDFWNEKILVPIPLHWTRKWQRGFNQAELIAREMQKINPKIQISLDLKRIKKTAQQARLSKHLRLQNVEDAFLWNKKSKVPQKIILLDDVFTTGSTMESAAKSLKKSGTKEVYATVFAIVE